MGPLNNAQQCERVKALLEDAVEQGYKTLTCGEPPKDGYFLPFTLIDNPREDSRIVQEEQFGRVVPLVKVADMDEAVARANANDFGLGASIWGRNEHQAGALAERLQSGTV